MIGQISAPAHRWAVVSLLTGLALLLPACKAGHVEALMDGTTSFVGDKFNPVGRRIFTALDDVLPQTVENLNVSEERQIEVASTMATQVEEEYRMVDDRRLERYVDQMLLKLAEASGDDRFTYQARIIDDPEMRAFTPGAGYVFVTTGLIRELDNEAQLAMVLAHELAHVTEGHVLENMRATGLIATAGTGTAVLMTEQGHGRAVETLADPIMNAAINGYSRSSEAAADRVGLRYMYDAGYDPGEAPEVFEHFLRVYGDEDAITNFFHGSHPQLQQRVEALRELVNEQYTPSDGTGVVDTPEYERLTARYR